MWFPFWRSRNRFSLDELRFLIDQLQKTQIITEVNKEFVVEALRSIAEIITYGDQHDPSFFEFFMEKQVMGEFVRLLRISKTVTVSVQLLQTMSIMIQNLKSEHAIYYIFSNEHINYLITYTFDFRHDELLSYYISFLRAISGKLNKNTISLLVKTENDAVVSFPLYVEAIQFAFHEENMIRTAVRALTLNVYHVGDESVNNFVAIPPQAEYFSNLVLFFHKQCLELSGLVSAVQKVPSLDSTSKLLSVIDDIEDNLYYFSDVVSAGIPDVGRLITDQILQHLILPLVLPSLCTESVNDVLIGSVTSLYLLCCILRIVKIKDLANTTAAAFFCPLYAFISSSEAKNDAHVAPNSRLSVSQQHQDNRIVSKEDGRSLGIALSSAAGNFQVLDEEFAKICLSSSHLTLREILLSYMTKGNDVQALGSLFVLATLLQTKELEESMLDAFGILPQRKKHKKLLLRAAHQCLTTLSILHENPGTWKLLLVEMCLHLSLISIISQALVGEGSGEEQLFSSNNGIIKDGLSNELDVYLQRLEEQFGLSILEVGSSPRVHRNQVVDALVSLLCRASISAETLWDGGWLLRQLLPYSESEFNCHHFEMLKDSYVKCANVLVLEIKGTWADLLITVLLDEWKKCKRVIEAPSPRKEPKSILLQLYKCDSEDTVASASSFAAGEKMCELVKVFVLLHQLQMFSLGRHLSEQPPILPPTDTAETSRAARAGLDVSSFKPGAEVRLVDAVPCRIAFERGKERHFSFLALSVDVSGWIILVEESPLKQSYGVLRVAAPLAGCNVGICYESFITAFLSRFCFEGSSFKTPRIDEKHKRWLNLKIRPSTLPVLDPARRGAYSKLKPNNLVDGRWTLAFRDDESCKSALSMVLEEMDLQSMKVEKRIKPLLQLEIPQHQPDLSSSS